MAEEKILSSEQTVNTTPDSVIAGESIADVQKEVITETLTLKERIVKSTGSGGLKHLPFGFDDQDGDWVCIKSSNPFEILFLDYRQYKFITPEIVKENYAILEKFWKDKVGLMNTGGNRIAFKTKYGDGIVENSLNLLKRAFDKLSTEKNIEQYYLEVNNERLRRGDENLRESIDDMMIDGMADRAEIELRLSRGLKYDLEHEETALIIKKYLDNKNFIPYGTPSGISFLEQLLSVDHWGTEQMIEEAERIKKERELLKIQILPGKYAKNNEEIGTILFEDPIEAKEIIKEDLLKQSIAQKDIVLAREIGALSKDSKNIDGAYLKIIYKLNSLLPYRFNHNQLAKNIEELCRFIFVNEQSLKNGKEDLKKGYIEVWLKETDKSAYDKFIRIRDTAENSELAFLEFLYTFNPKLPYRFAGNILVNSPLELCEQINKSKENWNAGSKELFNSSIPVWLKTVGKSVITDKWDKIKLDYKGNEGVGLEEFCHLLNEKLDYPKLNVNTSSVNFPKIQSGSVVTTELLFTNETRGYLEGKLSFSKVLERVTLSSDKIIFNSAEGFNTSNIILSIDSANFLKGVNYDTVIQLETSTGQKIDITVNFKVVFPKNNFILEIAKSAAILSAIFVLFRYLLSIEKPGWLNFSNKFFLSWDSAYEYFQDFSIYVWSFLLLSAIVIIGGKILINYLVSTRDPGKITKNINPKKKSK